MMFEAGSRHSGRTEHMLAQIKDGDWIITALAEEADRLRRECTRRGLKDVHVTSVDRAHPERAYEKLRGHRGRVFFDHLFHRAFIESALRSCEKQLGALVAGYRQDPHPPKEHMTEIRGRHLGRFLGDGEWMP